MKREHGFRRASIRSMHSFRTTWVTLALMAGIPEKLIQRVAGHKALEVVLLHHFNPGDAELHRVLAAKMPGVITGGPILNQQAQRMRKVKALLQQMTSEIWSSLREQALELVDDGDETFQLVV